MPPYATIDGLLDGVNLATNALGVRVGAIQAQLADMIANGASPAQLQSAADKLGVIQGELTSMAADPINPIPLARA